MCTIGPVNYECVNNVGLCVYRSSYILWSPVKGGREKARSKAIDGIGKKHKHTQLTTNTGAVGVLDPSRPQQYIQAVPRQPSRTP